MFKKKRKGKKAVKDKPLDAGLLYSRAMVMIKSNDESFIIVDVLTPEST